MNKDNYEYWNKRAEGYSKVNIEELEGPQRANWSKLLINEIEAKYPSYPRSQITILDIGAGPGFLSIILSESGYTVCAADFSEEMLLKAKENAADIGVDVTFFKENAQELSFKDHSFDVIISRNLTWNLSEPDKAYAEWLRVLKPGGLMMIFDANWYSYLCDEDSRKAYELDRENVKSSGLEDYNEGENFEKMEEIAKKLPLTSVRRPEWDKMILSELGVSGFEARENIGESLYSEKEKLNYKSTPLFMIKAVK